MPALSERDFSHVEKLLAATNAVLQHIRTKRALQREHQSTDMTPLHATSDELLVHQPSHSPPLHSRSTSVATAATPPPTHPSSSSPATSERRLWAQLGFVFWRIACMQKLSLVSYLTGDPRATLLELAKGLLDYHTAIFYSTPKEERLGVMAELGADHILYIVMKVCSQHTCIIMVGEGNEDDGRALHESICAYMIEKKHFVWMSLVYVGFCDEAVKRVATGTPIPHTYVTTTCDILRCMLHCCEANPACAAHLLSSEPVVCVTYLFYGLRLRLLNAALLRPHEADDVTVTAEDDWGKAAPRPLNPLKRVCSHSRYFHTVDVPRYYTQSLPGCLSPHDGSCHPPALPAAVSCSSQPLPSIVNTTATISSSFPQPPPVAPLPRGSSVAMSKSGLTPLELNALMAAGRLNCFDEALRLALDVVVESLRMSNGHRHWAFLSMFNSYFDLSSRALQDIASAAAAEMPGGMAAYRRGEPYPMALTTRLMAMYENMLSLLQLMLVSIGTIGPAAPREQPPQLTISEEALSDIQERRELFLHELVKCDISKYVRTVLNAAPPVLRADRKLFMVLETLCTLDRPDLLHRSRAAPTAVTTSWVITKEARAGQQLTPPSTNNSFHGFPDTSAEMTLSRRKSNKGEGGGGHKGEETAATMSRSFFKSFLLRKQSTSNLVDVESPLCSESTTSWSPSPDRLRQSAEGLMWSEVPSYVALVRDLSLVFRNAFTDTTLCVEARMAVGFLLPNICLLDSFTFNIIEGRATIQCFLTVLLEQLAASVEHENPPSSRRPIRAATASANNPTPPVSAPALSLGNILGFIDRALAVLEQGYCVLGVPPLTGETVTLTELPLYFFLADGACGTAAALEKHFTRVAVLWATALTRAQCDQEMDRRALEVLLTIFERALLRGLLPKDGNVVVDKSNSAATTLGQAQMSRSPGEGELKECRSCHFTQTVNWLFEPNAQLCFNNVHKAVEDGGMSDHSRTVSALSVAGVTLVHRQGHFLTGFAFATLFRLFSSHDSGLARLGKDCITATFDIREAYHNFVEVIVGADAAQVAPFLNLISTYLTSDSLTSDARYERRVWLFDTGCISATLDTLERYLTMVEYAASFEKVIPELFHLLSAAESSQDRSPQLSETTFWQVMDRCVPNIESIENFILLAQSVLDAATCNHGVSLKGSACHMIVVGVFRVSSTTCAAVKSQFLDVVPVLAKYAEVHDTSLYRHLIDVLARILQSTRNTSSDHLMEFVMSNRLSHLLPYLEVSRAVIEKLPFDGTSSELKRFWQPVLTNTPLRSEIKFTETGGVTIMMGQWPHNGFSFAIYIRFDSMHHTIPLFELVSQESYLLASKPVSVEVISGDSVQLAYDGRRVSMNESRAIQNFRTGEWMHICVVLKATDTIGMYLNGFLVGSCDLKYFTPDSEALIRIGFVDRTIPAATFSLGEVVLWDADLSAVQVTTTMAGGDALKTPSKILSHQIARELSSGFAREPIDFRIARFVPHEHTADLLHNLLQRATRLPVVAKIIGRYTRPPSLWVDYYLLWAMRGGIWHMIHWLLTLTEQKELEEIMHILAECTRRVTVLPTVEPRMYLLLATTLKRQAKFMSIEVCDQLIYMGTSCITDRDEESRVIINRLLFEHVLSDTSLYANMPFESAIYLLTRVQKLFCLATCHYAKQNAAFVIPARLVDRFLNTLVNNAVASSIPIREAVVECAKQILWASDMEEAVLHAFTSMVALLTPMEQIVTSRYNPSICITLPMVVHTRSSIPLRTTDHLCTLLLRVLVECSSSCFFPATFSRIADLPWYVTCVSRFADPLSVIYATALFFEAANSSPGVREVVATHQSTLLEALQVHAHNGDLVLLLMAIALGAGRRLDLLSQQYSIQQQLDSILPSMTSSMTPCAVAATIYTKIFCLHLHRVTTGHYSFRVLTSSILCRQQHLSFRVRRYLSLARVCSRLMMFINLQRYRHLLRTLLLPQPSKELQHSSPVTVLASAGGNVSALTGAEQKRESRPLTPAKLALAEVDFATASSVLQPAALVSSTTVSVLSVASDLTSVIASPATLSASQFSSQRGGTTPSRVHFTKYKRAFAILRVCVLLNMSIEVSRCRWALRHCTDEELAQRHEGTLFAIRSLRRCLLQPSLLYTFVTSPLQTAALSSLVGYISREKLDRSIHEWESDLMTSAPEPLCESATLAPSTNPLTPDLHAHNEPAQPLTVTLLAASSPVTPLSSATSPIMRLTLLDLHGRDSGSPPALRQMISAGSNSLRTPHGCHTSSKGHWGASHRSESLSSEVDCTTLPAQLLRDELATLVLHRHNSSHPDIYVTANEREKESPLLAASPKSEGDGVPMASHDLKERISYAASTTQPPVDATEVNEASCEVSILKEAANGELGSLLISGAAPLAIAATAIAEASEPAILTDRLEASDEEGYGEDDDNDERFGQKNLSRAHLNPSDASASQSTLQSEESASPFPCGDETLMYVESLASALARLGEVVLDEAADLINALIQSSLHVLPRSHWIGGKRYGACGGLLFQMLLITATAPGGAASGNLIRYFLFHVAQKVLEHHQQLTHVESTGYGPQDNASFSQGSLSVVSSSSKATPVIGPLRAASSANMETKDVLYVSVSNFTELVVDMLCVNVLDLPTANSYFLLLLSLCNAWPIRYVDQLSAQVMRTCIAVLNRPSTEEMTLSLIGHIFLLSKLVLRRGWLGNDVIESMFRGLYRVYTSFPPIWMTEEDAQERLNYIALIFKHIMQTYADTKELHKALQVRTLTQRYSLYDPLMEVFNRVDDAEACAAFDKYCAENASVMEALMSGRPKAKADLALKASIRTRSEYIKRIRAFNQSYCELSEVLPGKHVYELRRTYLSAFSSYASLMPVVGPSQMHLLALNLCPTFINSADTDSSKHRTSSSHGYHYFDSQRNYSVCTPKYFLQQDKELVSDEDPTNADVLHATFSQEHANHIAVLVPPLAVRCRPDSTAGISSGVIDPSIVLTPSAHTLLRYLLEPQEPLHYVGNAFRISGIHTTPCLLLLTNATLKVISFSYVTQDGDIILCKYAHGDVKDDTTTDGMLCGYESGYSFPDANVKPSSAKRDMKAFTLSVTKHLQRMLGGDSDRRNKMLHRDGTRVAQSVQQSTSHNYHSLYWTYALRSLRQVRILRYMHLDTALILQFDHDDGPMLSVVDRTQSMNPKARAKFLMVLKEVVKNQCCTFYDDATPAAGLRSMLVRWAAGSVSNYEYLSFLNVAAGRTIKNYNQYPVFPWVLSNYTSDSLDFENPTTFRDFTYPMGAQTEVRRQMVQKFYNNTAEMYDGNESSPGRGSHPFHHGTHYSTSGGVLYYLIRVEPFTTLAKVFQGGVFDIAARLFDSVAASYSSCVLGPADCKELVPEFYYNAEFLRNADHLDFGAKPNGEVVDSVKLPPWAKGSVQVFTAVMRYALESEYVLNHIHSWIDLIFGACRRGQPAIEHFNVFQQMTYGEEVAKALQTAETPHDCDIIIAEVDNFGQAPMQLFQERHPSHAELEPVKASWALAGSSGGSLNPTSRPPNTTAVISTPLLFISFSDTILAATSGASVPSPPSAESGHTYTLAFARESPKVLGMVAHAADTPQSWFQLSTPHGSLFQPLPGSVVEYFQGSESAVLGFERMRQGKLVRGSRRIHPVGDTEHCICWSERENRLMRFSIHRGQFLSSLALDALEDSRLRITAVGVSPRESLVMVAVSSGAIYCYYPDTRNGVLYLNATLCHHSSPVVGLIVSPHFCRAISFTRQANDFPIVWRVQRFFTSKMHQLDVLALFPDANCCSAHDNGVNTPMADHFVVSACMDRITAFSILITKRSLLIFDNNGLPFGVGTLPMPPTEAPDGLLLEDEHGEMVGVPVVEPVAFIANLTAVEVYQTQEWASGMQLYVTGHQDGSLSLWRSTRLPPDTVQPGRIALVEFHAQLFDGSETEDGTLGKVTSIQQVEEGKPSFLVGFCGGSVKMLSFSEPTISNDGKAK